jgi:hypothetical protein
LNFHARAEKNLERKEMKRTKRIFHFAATTFTPSRTSIKFLLLSGKTEPGRRTFPCSSRGKKSARGEAQQRNREREFIDDITRLRMISV